MRARGATSPLDQPKQAGRRGRAQSRDPERFPRAAEAFARFLGTPRYLIAQSVYITSWVLLNVLAVTAVLRWDPYPFILLNLTYTMIAAYAAPFILLSQSRQADRDRVQTELDRALDRRGSNDLTYLIEEVRDLSRSVENVVSRTHLRVALDDAKPQIAAFRAALRARQPG